MSEKHPTSLRQTRQGGSELLEFALVLIPFLALVTVLLSTGWAVFAKSTIQRAVRVGVDQGVSLSAGQLKSGACLTDTVKAVVQQSALGLLNGASGLAAIKVNYFQPPAAGSSSAVTDVSSQSNADLPGNIMQVSVQNYSLAPLVPRIFLLQKNPVDKSPLAVTVYASGVIQLTQTEPCVGTAP